LVIASHDGLPGGGATSLQQQGPPHVDAQAGYGMFARTLVSDDAMSDYLVVVPPWLARWSLTQGWIGYARETTDLMLWLYFYAMDGHAYGASPSNPARCASPRHHSRYKHRRLKIFTLCYEASREGVRRLPLPCPARLCGASSKRQYKRRVG
jgi:hypothetical protein